MNNNVNPNAFELDLSQLNDEVEVDYHYNDVIDQILTEIELKYNSQISTAEINAAQNIDREAIRQQAVLAQQQAAQFVQQTQPMQPMASSPINLNGMAQ